MAALPLGCLLLFLLASCSKAGFSPEPRLDPVDAKIQEARLLSNIRQLTFVGRRSGEGYFSSDGSLMILQSERKTNNPFYQIYLLDLESGMSRRVSPGTGKTTCGWIHPNNKAVLFSSTHEDQDAEKKEKKELELRRSGKQRRYSWDYDKHYEIYSGDLFGRKLQNLSNALGYDAEASWSPDGKKILFASNRLAYEKPLSPEEEEIFQRDKSFFVDLYEMNSDGSGVRKLTSTPGYDGGPFYGADGKSICWRRFSEDGHSAEIFTMDSSGENERQLTRLGVLSWAPFFHPSGEYLIFATNLHGFGNFELYLVDNAGKKKPVRASFSEGFDGLPVFSPDGKTLAWTSKRTADKSSQIFLADWNHKQALNLIRGSEAVTIEPESSQPKKETTETKTEPEIRAADIEKHVRYLASEELEGRFSGSKGERLATSYAAKTLERFGFKPAGEDGTFFQEFTFSAGVSLGEKNTLEVLSGKQAASGTELKKDWLPLSFSQQGEISSAGIAFAGYGIVAPKTENFGEYDSYVHLDVKDKWVMVFRFLPDGLSAEQRRELRRFSSTRHKAMSARDKGARGIIFVSGPRSKVRRELIGLSKDASLAGTSIAAISISDSLAEKLLKGSGKTLSQLQDNLSGGKQAMGFQLKGVQLSAEIEIKQQERVGRNVLARLPAGNAGKAPLVAIGAHIDHLGRGGSSGSLARKGEEGKVHYGADDNASGVASVLEIAELLADEKRRGSLSMKRDLLVALWSGEELGILGSTHFAKKMLTDNPKKEDLGDSVSAYINLDMVGRLKDKLTLGGTGSSSRWNAEIERGNIKVGLALNLQEDSYLPTDTTAFYTRGVPILNAYTGAHDDYHTPRDTADLVNYPGAEKISQLLARITRSLLTSKKPADYLETAKPNHLKQRAFMRAYLGTIPDYTGSKEPGLLLSGVRNGGPADKAGLKGGDRIVRLAGKRIENIYDYTYAIEALEIDVPTKVELIRDGSKLTLEIVPASRQ